MEPEMGCVGDWSSGPSSPSLRDASSAAAIAASRRRKQSKPRQLASTDLDNEDMDVTTIETGEVDQMPGDEGVDTQHDVTGRTRCPRCHVTFDDERRFMVHAQFCGTVAMATDYDDDDDDDDDVYRSSNESSEPELTSRKPETDTDRYASKPGCSDDDYPADFRCVRSLPEEEILRQTTRENNFRSAAELFHQSMKFAPYNLSTIRSSSDVPETPMTSSPLNKMADISRILGLDVDLSPSSKIAMLESAIFGLHRQQLMQLELIDTLRRQLAIAIAAKTESTSPPPCLQLERSATCTTEVPEPNVVNSATDDPSTATYVGSNSSLSGLMRLSASVDKQAPYQPRQLTSPRPATNHEHVELNRTDDVTQKNASDYDPTKSRDQKTVVPPCVRLSDLSLFKKAKAPNATVGKTAEQVPAPVEIPMSSSTATTGSDDSGGAGFKHRCHMCLKVLGSDSALQIHMRSHTGERPYKCNICGNRFTTKGNLKVHFQRHLEQYPNARMNPDPVPEYLDHQLAAAHQPLALTSSASSALDHSFQKLVGNAHSSMLQSAQSFVHQQLANLAAEKCSTTSTSSGTPQRNHATESSVSKQFGNDQNTVITSSSQLLSSSRFESHPLPSPLSALSSMSSALATSFSPHPMMRGGGAGTGFPGTVPVPSSTMAPTHIQVAPQPMPPALNSPVVPTTFRPSLTVSTGVPSAALPMASLKPDLDDDEALEQYMEIQQTDTSKIEELVREATAAAAVAASGSEGKNSEGGDPNECILCHRVLSCRSALQMHYRTHTGERPYRCRLCGRTFTTKGNLKTHMTVHRARSSGIGIGVSVGGHRCPVCRRDFTGSLALQQHMRASHSTTTSASSSLPPPTSGEGVEASAGVSLQSTGPLSLPFPVTMPSQLRAGPSGPNHAAMAAAAAMMMMPGLNPLLPFINFPFYPAAAFGGPSVQPRGCAPMFVPHYQQSSKQNDLTSQQSDGEDFRTTELDLCKKKTPKVDEKRKMGDEDDNDDAETDEHGHASGNSNKRSKLISEHSAVDLSPREEINWSSSDNRHDSTPTKQGRAGPYFNEDETNDDGGQYVEEIEQRGVQNNEQHVRGFDYMTPKNQSMRSDGESGTTGKDEPVDDNNWQMEVTPKKYPYSSPLLALEEKLNAITRKGTEASRREKLLTEDYHQIWRTTDRHDDGQDTDSINNEDLAGNDGFLKDEQNNCLDRRHFSTSSAEDRLVVSDANQAKESVLDDGGKREPRRHHGTDASESSADSRESCSMPSSPGGVSVTESGPMADKFSGSRGSSLESNSSSGFTRANRFDQQRTEGASDSSPSKSTMSVAVSQLAKQNHHHHHHHLHQNPQINAALSPLARFVCNVCSKPFASASALEIHSRTHSGDRPFVCQVCSKAFTTKGNLKVHMGTHAWNRCPSRRGRRMSVVDPNTAAAAAAAVAASSSASVSAAGSSLGAGVMPRSAVDFFSAAAAAVASGPYSRFIPDGARPMSVFGYAPPTMTSSGTLVGSSPSSGAYFSDGRHNAGFGAGFSATSTGDDEKSIKLLTPEQLRWLTGSTRDERINNNNNSIGTGSRKPPVSFGLSAATPRACTSSGGELDLSVGRSGSGQISTSVSTTSFSPRDETPIRSHRSVPTGSGGVIVAGAWSNSGANGDRRGTSSLKAVMSNCG